MEIVAEENASVQNIVGVDAARLLSFYSEAPQEELTLDEFET